MAVRIGVVIRLRTGSWRRSYPPRPTWQELISRDNRVEITKGSLIPTCSVRFLPTNSWRMGACSMCGHQVSSMQPRRESVVPKKWTGPGAIRIPGDHVHLRPCKKDDRSQSIRRKPLDIYYFRTCSSIEFIAKFSRSVADSQTCLQGTCCCVSAVSNHW